MRSLSGVTLLELLVVVLVIGLVAALAAPALVRPRPRDAESSSTTRVLDAARAAAVRRAETLVLDVARDGRWSLVVAHADSQPLATGTLDASSATPLRLVVTPLGLCMPDVSRGVVATGAWDASSCRPAAATGERP